MKKLLILLSSLCLPVSAFAFQNLFVEVNITHPNRSDLIIELGIGDPDNPDKLIELQRNQTNPSGQPSETNVDQIYSVTIDDELFPPMPSGSNLYWLRVTDNQPGNFGTLTRWCIAREHNPSATDLPCHYVPVDLNPSIDITDGQQILSFLGVEPASVGQTNTPDRQSCAGIYGDFTSNALFAGQETGFYLQADGSGGLSGYFTSNVAFGNAEVIASVMGNVTASGQCQIAILFAGTPAENVCPFGVAGILQDFEEGGQTFGLFTLGGGMMCEEIFPQLGLTLMKVSG
jgi:subtilisin-like proprotein convertase family protein